MPTNQLRRMLCKQNPHQNHPVTKLPQTVHQYEEQVLEMLSDLLNLRATSLRALIVLMTVYGLFLLLLSFDLPRFSIVITYYIFFLLVCFIKKKEKEGDVTIFTMF